MGKPRNRRHNATGRSVEGQYWKLDYEMARSDAVRQLSGSALKILVELRTRYNGSNNGRLTLSFDEAARLLGLSKTTAKRAVDELIVKGFTIRTKRGRWYGRLASEYEVTFLPRSGSPATNEWRNWRASKPLKEAKKIKPRYSNGIPACFDDAA